MEQFCLLGKKKILPWILRAGFMDGNLIREKILSGNWAMSKHARVRAGQRKVKDTDVVINRLMSLPMEREISMVTKCFQCGNPTVKKFVVAENW